MMGTPGEAIHIDENGLMIATGSLVMTVADYKNQKGWIIKNEPYEPYIPGKQYGWNGHYRTYENVFKESNKNIDLWLYAVVPNNRNFELTEWNEFDCKKWEYIDGSSFDEHRNTFLGALIFLMNEMYTLNPKAKMVLVLDSSSSYEQGIMNFELIKDELNVPIIDL